MGGNAFKVPCTIEKNGLGIKTSSLIDTGALGYAFADNTFVANAEQFLGTERQPLSQPCSVRGYDGQSRQEITHLIHLTLEIAGHVQKNIPFLILELKGHDLILGKKWLANSNALLDCKEERIIWRNGLITEKRWNRILTTTAESLLNRAPLPEHQTNAERRDQLMALEEKKWKPKKILSRTEPQPRMVKTPPTKPSEFMVDICCISAPAFNKHLKKKDCLMFYTTLHEIDSLLEHHEANPTERKEDETEEQWIRRRLPERYQQYADVFSKQASDTLPPHRKWDHTIELEGENLLSYHPLYRQSPQELEATKKYIIENLDKGFIEASQAPFAAPILFVKKPNGGLRFCVDYRKLNALTRKDRYPLPLIDETLRRLSKAKIFTKLDIRQAFHRIRMDPNSEELTTFRTRYGLYKYKVMPFGLTNGPATYQRYMNDILFEYLDQFCTAYMDDILIFSEDPAEHEEHVKKVLQKLRDSGLQADLDKSEFHVTETRYLGFIISTEGIMVDPKKVAAIAGWRTPGNVKSIQSFLGFCNFYRRFIQEYGRVARPLTLMTRKGAPFIWNQPCQDAFERLKNALINPPVLKYFQYGREHMLETDASDGVTAAVLSELDPDTQTWHPVAYTSKTMAPAECNYPIHDKEMLAIIRAFEEWKPELLGHDTTVPVYSDHRALEYFMTTKQLSARQVRWAEYLSQFNFRIAFRAGKSNEKADTLTRREQDVKSQETLMKESRFQTMLQPEQLSPEVLQDVQLAPVTLDQSLLIDRILQDNRTAAELDELRIKAQKEPESVWGLKEGLLLREGKLVVPDTQWKGIPLKTALIREAHSQLSTAHPGRTKTTQILKERYYWTGLGSDVAQYIRNCHDCRRAHVSRDKTPGLLQPLAVPYRPWQHITVDFKEFPPSANGYDMIVVFVDRLGKRPISIPCHKTIDAKHLAKLFINNVYRYWGAPESIVSDRGPQFISQFWNEFCTALGIKLKLSTAHHAQTDGQTEIVNQYIDQRLRPFVNYYQDNWDELLPIIDFAQASMKHEATGQSPIFTEMGYELRCSFDWNKPRDPAAPKDTLNQQEAKDLVKRIHDAWKFAQDGVSQAQQRYATQANKKRREIDFDVGDSVWVTTKHWNLHRPSRKLAEQNAGPFRILERYGNAFKLDLPDSIKVHPVFNADKLRKEPNDPLEGQVNKAPPPIEVDGEQEWEVDRILGVRLVHGKLKYRVKWLGFDDDLDEYPASNFKHAPQALKDFHDKYPELPGPPRNLDYWIQTALADEQSEDRPDDDKPEDRPRSRGG